MNNQNTTARRITAAALVALAVLGPAAILACYLAPLTSAPDILTPAALVAATIAAAASIL